MIIQIPIRAVPNQSLNVVIGSLLTTVNINTRNVLQNVSLITNRSYATTVTFVDIITNNNNNIILGVQANELPIIPYRYLSDSNFQGNFIFINSDNVDRPINYANFGSTQFLIFYNYADLQ